MSLSVGVISDTHDLVRPEAVSALKDCDVIIHAGDVGDDHVINALSKYARVHAVKGNMDASSGPLRSTVVVEVAGHVIYVLHDIDKLDLDPAAAKFDMVVFGHSHKPEIYNKDGVIYLNPGSAGPRRFSLPVTVARISVENDGLFPEIVHLDV